MSDKLKVGLLVSDRLVSIYDSELVEWAINRSDIDIQHLIIYGGKSSIGGVIKKIPKTGKGGVLRLLSWLLFKIEILIEHVLLQLDHKHRHHLKRMDGSLIIPNLHFVKPEISQSGDISGFPVEDLEKVRRLKLDLLIYRGDRALVGGILDCAKLGVLTVHYGDPRNLNAKVAGFWEVYNRGGKTAFQIKKISALSGEVLKQGTYVTAQYFLLNQARICRKASFHLKNLLEEIASCNRLPKAKEAVLSYSIPNDEPGFRSILLYLMMTYYRGAGKIFKKIFSIKYRWRVSYIHSDWQTADFSKAKCIPTPIGHFLADPFLIERDGKTYCFVEDFLYKNNKGRISVYEIGAEGAAEVGVCLEEPFHLSFPFLFDFEGDLYMCPETYQAREIRIYKCVEFPLHWQLESIAMNNISAVDTMLFPHNGKWWMLTSMDSEGTLNFCSELYLFYADSPLSASWKAHPCNPIYLDSDGGRNAGLIVKDKKTIFRMAQKQDFDMYGRGILIFEIALLNETEYSEKQLGSIEPNFRPGILGTHHISSNGKTTVIDHVVMEAV